MIISTSISLVSTKIYISKLVSGTEFQSNANDILNNIVRQYLPYSTSTLGKLSSKGFLGLESNLLKIDQNKKTLISFSQVNLSLSLFSLLSKPRIEGSLSKLNENLQFSIALNKETGTFEKFEAHIEGLKISSLLNNYLQKSNLIFSNATLHGSIKQSTLGLQSNFTIKNLSTTPRGHALRSIKKYVRVPKKLVFADTHIKIAHKKNSFNLLEPIELKSKIGKIVVSGNLISKNEELHWNTTVRSKGTRLIAFLAQSLFQCPRRTGLNFYVKGPTTRPNCQNIGKR